MLYALGSMVMTANGRNGVVRMAFVVLFWELSHWTTNWIEHLSTKSGRSVVNKVSGQSQGDALYPRYHGQGCNWSEGCRSAGVHCDIVAA